MESSSRPVSPLPVDHAEKLNEYIQSLYLEREDVAAELEVLASIYDHSAIRIWNHSNPNKGRIRYEVNTNLPSFEDVQVQILVTVTELYPSQSPPQLQLLSRYIGPFGIDQDLFGDILKTFISLKSGVEFVPESVVVFDGLQNVLDRCCKWYGERLSEKKAGSILWEEKRSRGQSEVIAQKGEIAKSHIHGMVSTVATLPEGVELVEGEPITDRKSVFIGRACRIGHPSQVEAVLGHLMSDKRIARAAHPIINAWRCTVNGVKHQDSDDDGETAAGGRLAHLLQIMDLDNVLVIVTRYFGGVLLGADRFKHINQAARLALEKGHFLDTDEKIKGNARVNPRKRP